MGRLWKTVPLIGWIMSLRGRGGMERLWKTVSLIGGIMSLRGGEGGEVMENCSFNFLDYVIRRGRLWKTDPLIG